jgi:hypothetical protein
VNGSNVQFESATGMPLDKKKLGARETLQRDTRTVQKLDRASKFRTTSRHSNPNFQSVLDDPRAKWHGTCVAQPLLTAPLRANAFYLAH